MKKKLINQRRDEMKSWTPQALVDHVLNYPDQDALKYDYEGERRYPNLSSMAEVISNNNYEMSDAQYYSLLDNFTKVVIPEMKVVGVSFADPDLDNVSRHKVFEKGVLTRFEVDYTLKPEPDNEYDPNAVAVFIDEERIGYLPAEFVKRHPITQEMNVEGIMNDHSNGHLSNVSYDISLDTENLNQSNRLQLSMDDLMDLEDDYQL